MSCTPPAQCRIDTCWQPGATPGCNGMCTKRVNNSHRGWSPFGGGDEEFTTRGSTRIYDVGGADATRQCARKAQRMARNAEKHEVSKHFYFRIRCGDPLCMESFIVSYSWLLDCCVTLCCLSLGQSTVQPGPSMWVDLTRCVVHQTPSS